MGASAGSQSSTAQHDLHSENLVGTRIHGRDRKPRIQPDLAGPTASRTGCEVLWVMGSGHVLHVWEAMEEAHGLVALELPIIEFLSTQM